MEKESIKEEIGVSSSGSRYYVPLDYEYSEEAKCMVPVFKKPLDRFEMIQASKPSCDINYIVKRALAGDMTALNVKQPTYADVSEIPDNLNDLHKMNIEAINSFSKLDPNIRKLFNNDVDQFISAVENGTYAKIISDALSVQEEVKEEGKE